MDNHQALKNLIVIKYKEIFSENEDIKLPEQGSQILLNAILLSFDFDRIYYEEWINSLIKQNTQLKNLQDSLRNKIKQFEEFHLNDKRHLKWIGKDVQSPLLSQLAKKIQNLETQDNLITQLKSEMKKLKGQYLQIKEKNQNLQLKKLASQKQIQQQNKNIQSYKEEIQIYKKSIEDLKEQMRKQREQDQNLYARQLKQHIQILRSGQIHQLKETNRRLSNQIQSLNGFIQNIIDTTWTIFQLQKKQKGQHDLNKTLETIKQKGEYYKNEIQRSLKSQASGQKGAALTLSNVIKINQNKLMARNHLMSKYIQ